ncbi:MAG: nicotinate phosphoribosyltransferase [Firmicutes bacterium]|nr:nicotinate phosphoribosyltransferase [Bacillota bacterium]
MPRQNQTMHTDLYQLTMMYGYYRAGTHKREAVFDLFFRTGPFGGNHVITAGLEQAIEYIQNLHFSQEDLDYLASLKLFSPDFLDFLRDFTFTGDILAMPEGTVAFPHEPLVRVKAPIYQGQLIETALLAMIGHQSLIATKAARVVQAAEGDPVLEFGLRRAQGLGAGLYGARAAIVGGCAATSNLLAGQVFGVPVSGTHAHSWVMSFPTELDAFRAYAAAYPDACLLLVDTYDTLRSGVPNAIIVGKELEAKGHKLLGIRLDSGDISYLSREARKMLDSAGLTYAKIVASNDLDEHLIRDLKQQGAKVDTWGVGTNLITARDNPALGAVYKMVAEEVDGKFVPKIKVSENREKTTNPGVKRPLRLMDNSTGKAIADLIILEEEVIDTSKPLTIFDPIETWKRKTLRNFSVQELLTPIFLQGELVYSLPSLPEIQQRAKENQAAFWPEHIRLINPQEYYVDLSEPLWNLKQQLIEQERARIQNGLNGR